VIGTDGGSVSDPGWGLLGPRGRRALGRGLRRAGSLGGAARLRPGRPRPLTWYSSTAERCCVDSGLCCQDMGDLDYDGDTWESLGACDDISCG
jgi:hypothetical protein